MPRAKAIHKRGHRLKVVGGVALALIGGSLAIHRRHKVPRVEPYVPRMDFYDDWDFSPPRM